MNKHQRLLELYEHSKELALQAAAIAAQRNALDIEIKRLLNELLAEQEQ